MIITLMYHLRVDLLEPFILFSNLRSYTENQVKLFLKNKT